VEGADAPWPVIEQTVMAFDPMCRALLESKNADIKDSADGYVDSVKELAAAVKRRDAKALRAGFESLRQSCGDCHFQGGVGGELDD
jgi:mono/diheme cytochrome c family protein